jgi:bifunctional ADP-heptose synthase (sugar kinase/adenylyltransferase)
MVESSSAKLIEDLINRDREMPCRILVIGDGMTDIYVHGRLEEACQEGCGKFVEKGRVTVPGGVANAARSLEGWKARVRLCAIPSAGPVKTRFMADNYVDAHGKPIGRQVCCFRHDDDRNRADVVLICREALRVLENFEYPPNAVLLSDYDKGTLSPAFISKVAGICWDQRIPCVADCKRAPEVYAGCLLKGNKAWGDKYTPSVTEQCYRYVETQGAAPPQVWEKGWLDDIPPLPLVTCVNHVGAGDCFAAHLTLGLAYGLSLKDAARIAYSAGRVYVQHPHNRPPQPAEIRADMEQAIVG